MCCEMFTTNGGCTRELSLCILTALFVEHNSPVLAKLRQSVQTGTVKATSHFEKLSPSKVIPLPSCFMACFPTFSMLCKPVVGKMYREVCIIFTVDYTQFILSKKVIIKCINPAVPIWRKSTGLPCISLPKWPHFNSAQATNR